MLLKQKWLYITLMLILSPVAAYSQISFYELPVGKTDFGFEFSPQTDVTTFGARIDYGITNNSKVSFGTGIGFADDHLSSYGGDISPLPGVGLSVLHFQSLGLYEIEYFLQGASNARFAWVVDNVMNETLVRSRTFSLSGTGGILKRLKTQSGRVIVPFFALSYTNVWETVDIVLNDFVETESDGSLNVSIGSEIEISPKISIIGSFSFQRLDTVFSIGLNFH